MPKPATSPSFSSNNLQGLPYSVSVPSLQPSLPSTITLGGGDASRNTGAGFEHAPLAPYAQNSGMVGAREGSNGVDESIDAEALKLEEKLKQLRSVLKEAVDEERIKAQNAEAKLQMMEDLRGVPHNIGFARVRVHRFRTNRPMPMLMVDAHGG